MGFFDKFFNKQKEEDLNKGLEKTKDSFFSKLSKAVVGKSTVDEDVLDELENILISSDVGVDTTLKIIQRIEDRVAREKYLNSNELNKILKEEVTAILGTQILDEVEDYDVPVFIKPYVILVVGVNGVGKTTTIGKLAYQYKLKGYDVLMAAGDTFRAAAVDQLKIWSERVGCGFFSKGMNVDPAAVAYEAVQHAMKHNYHIVIIDTAGRLHNKVNLMNELGKINRSINKSKDGAPNETILVLDATTGQNAFEQCKQFSEATGVNCLALTKLDGTAKGGVAIGISDQFKIPIKYIGVGEAIDKLQIFNKEAFVNSLFNG